MTYVELRDCSTCRCQQPFEAPDCADGHDLDCPDLACVECGEAVVFGRLAGWAGHSTGRPVSGRSGESTAA